MHADARRGTDRPDPIRVHPHSSAVPLSRYQPGAAQIFQDEVLKRGGGAGADVINAVAAAKALEAAAEAVHGSTVVAEEGGADADLTLLARLRVDQLQVSEEVRAELGVVHDVHEGD